MQEPEFVRYEREGRLGVITLDRPPLNAYDDLLRGVYGPRRASTRPVG